MYSKTYKTILKILRNTHIMKRHSVSMIYLFKEKKEKEREKRRGHTEPPTKRTTGAQRAPSTQA